MILAASTLETTRLLLYSKSADGANGLANSSGAVGHYFCEHIMGPGRERNDADCCGSAHHQRRRPAAEHVHRRGSGTSLTVIREFIRGYGFQGGSGSAEYPATRTRRPASASRSSRRCAATSRRRSATARFGEVLARRENQVDLDPAMKDAWGIPVLRFDYRFGDNELKMAAGHGRHRRGDAAAPPARRTSRWCATR